ncbi:hypothetical protein L873DRAFT_1683883 [Choiromyces venosus 120613-1]|uniref:LITAF domain-containing protein n=1 Tax=Choiromyces venosus 120613-1 TaxID=1336337 RepID=A0A3N4JQ96_9PEZI|nr:hypothetical protein L873DRAFT_1683883 [Choiromyces venosus 120613-1]
MAYQTPQTQTQTPLPVYDPHAAPATAAYQHPGVGQQYPDGSGYQNEQQKQQQQYYAAAPQQYPQQQAIPMQQQGGQQFLQATPIPALSRGSAPVDCPICGQRKLTSVSYEVGSTTHLWAAVACVVACLGCIPYLMTSLKDVQHRCGQCGTLLAIWHRSGGAEVLVHPQG